MIIEKEVFLYKIKLIESKHWHVLKTTDLKKREMEKKQPIKTQNQACFKNYRIL